MQGLDEQALLAIAHEAADAAASELLARFGYGQEGIRAKSSSTDLVSDADLAAESAIRRVLGERRPGDAILGEEGGETPGGELRTGGGELRTGGGELRWVVDPLDGTINFLFGIPQFAVSVACEDREGTVVGVVLDPLRGERFAAARGGPATLDDSAIRGSSCSELGSALLATGFGYDPAVRERQAAVVSRVLPRARDLRRAGAAALDLAWCACGRYDAYYERGVKAWDVAAGALIARRAGLSVRWLPATGEDPAGIVVAPEALIEELHELVSR